MSLEILFERAVVELRRREVAFAVAGGMAADLYRKDLRLTMDVDMVIVAGTNERRLAESVLHALGLQSGVIRKADLDGGPLFAIRRKSTAPCMIVGRSNDDADSAGVDILLSVLPWAEHAVRRAQSNLVDFGFGAVPVMTVEDVIISKLYALKAAPIRAKDMDDLQSIFEAGHEIDTVYLAAQIKLLNITLPDAAVAFMPSALLKIIKQH